MGEQYELLRRSSYDSASSSHGSFQDAYPSLSAKSSFLRSSLWRFLRLPFRRGRVIYTKGHRQSRRRERFLRCGCWTSVVLIFVVAILVVFTAAFRPSYTRFPDHYRMLRKRCLESKEPGRGNINNEKIFIAATLYDPDGLLVEGDWEAQLSD